MIQGQLVLLVGRDDVHTQWALGCLAFVDSMRVGHFLHLAVGLRVAPAVTARVIQVDVFHLIIRCDDPHHGLAEIFSLKDDEPRSASSSFRHKFGITPLGLFAAQVVPCTQNMTVSTWKTPLATYEEPVPNAANSVSENFIGHGGGGDLSGSRGWGDGSFGKQAAVALHPMHGERVKI